MQKQVFCGMLARIAQFADILRDSRQQINKVLRILPSPCMRVPSPCMRVGKKPSGQHSKETSGPQLHAAACLMPCLQGLYRQAILGDLNTMAHGIARLSPHYCCDYMRLWSIGQPEALFWHHNLMCVPDPDYQPYQDSQPKGVTAWPSHQVLRMRYTPHAAVRADGAAWHCAGRR